MSSPPRVRRPVAAHVHNTTVASPPYVERSEGSSGGSGSGSGSLSGPPPLPLLRRRRSSHADLLSPPDSVAEMLLSGRARSASVCSEGGEAGGSGPHTGTHGGSGSGSGSHLTSPSASLIASPEVRIASARKRTYSFTAGSPFISPHHSAEPPVATAVPASGKGGLLAPPSPAARAWARTAAGLLRPSPSPPPPSLALLPLMSGSSRRDLSDPLPLSAAEVLLEEEEEDDGPDSLIDEAGEQRQWRSLRGMWAMVSLLLSLAVQLMRSMGMTTKWMRMLGRLVCFSVALAPAWVIIGRTYFTAKFIKRGVRYGLNSRNFLDIYLPHEVVTTTQATGSGGAAASKEEQTQRARVLRALPLVSRFGSGQLLRSVLSAVKGLPLDAQRHIDANAARELELASASAAASSSASDGSASSSSSSSSSSSTTSDRGAQFAAALTSNAQHPAASPSSSTRVRVQQLSPGASPTSSSCCVSPAHGPARHAGAHVPGCQEVLAPRPLAPVVIFLTGGAWSIGYKAWGALLGLGLSAHGVLVASVDYRNFPEGDIADMSLDVQTAITFIFRHVEVFGGDPNRVFLAGQSAGAHLGSLAVLQNCEQLLAGRRTSWTAMKLRGFIGISGPYDLPHIQEHLDARGLPSLVFRRMMRSRNDEDLAKWSPARLAQQPWLINHMKGGAGGAHASGSSTPLPRTDRLLPPFLLIHGKADKTVHFAETDFFARCLHKAGVPVSVRYYKNYSHTDPIIEGPLTGHDHLAHDLLAFITTQSEMFEQSQREKQNQMAPVILHTTPGKSISILPLSPDPPAQRRLARMQDASSQPPSVSTSPPIFSASLSDGAAGSIAKPSSAKKATPTAAASSSSSTAPSTEAGAVSPPGHEGTEDTTSTRVQSKGDTTNPYVESEGKDAQEAADDGVHSKGDTHQLSHDPSASPVDQSPTPHTWSKALHPLNLSIESILPKFLLPSPTASWGHRRGRSRRSKKQQQKQQRLQRARSRLHHPFQFIDDVNDTDDEFTDEDEGDDSNSEGGSSSSDSSDEEEDEAASGDAHERREAQRHEERMQRNDFSPRPDPAAQAKAAQRRTERAARRPNLLMRIILALFSIVAFFLPARLTAPLRRLLVGSSPSAPSPSPPSLSSPDDAFSDTKSPSVARHHKASDLGTDPAADPTPPPISSHSVTPLARNSRRYVYPLQAAAQLPRRPPRPLIPRVLIRMARYINPF